MAGDDCVRCYDVNQFALCYIRSVLYIILSTFDLCSYSIVLQARFECLMQLAYPHR